MGQPQYSAFPAPVLHDALHLLSAYVAAPAPRGPGLAPAGILVAVLGSVCAAITAFTWDYYRREEARADAAATAAYQQLADEVAVAAAGLRVEMAFLAERERAVEHLMREAG